MKRYKIILILIAVLLCALQGVGFAVTVVANPNPALAGQQVSFTVSGFAGVPCPLTVDYEGTGATVSLICATNPCTLLMTHSYAAGTYRALVTPSPVASCGAPGSTTVTVNACPAMFITSGSAALSNGAVGTPYNASINGNKILGGQPVVNYVLTGGSLPPPLVMDTAGNISGTPTSSGTFSFTVRATDSCPAPQVVSRTLTITIPCPALSITTGALANGTTGTFYSSTVQTSGGVAPVTFAMATGTLPPGLTLAANGTLSGTPTTTGNYNFTVTATDSCPTAPQTTAHAYTVRVSPPVCPALSITTGALSNGTAGTFYSSQVQSTGGVAPVTFAMATGTLPPGLTLAANGTLSGTPTTTGNYNFTIRATDNCPAAPQTAQQAYTVTVACPALNITTGALPNGTMGTFYNSQAQSTGGVAPVTFAMASGTLPPGLTLAANGTLSGTPTTTGNYNFTIRATDNCPAAPQTAQQAYNVTISPAACPALNITTGALPNGTMGTLYNSQVQSTGGVAPVTFAMATGTFPPGITLATNGTLNGTPTTAGNYNFTIRATDSCPVALQTAQQAYTVTVSPVACPPLNITTATLTNGTVGTFYNSPVQSTGGVAPVTFAMATGTLPPGLTLAANGTLSGTPTTAGNYNFTVRATDSCLLAPQTTTRGYTMTVAGTIPVEFLSVNASPASFSIARGETGLVNISYLFSGTQTITTAINSVGGTFEASGRVIASNPIPLTAQINNGSGSVSETLKIPVSVLENVLQSNATTFQYSRTFINSQFNVRAVVTFSITSSDALATFGIKRIDLYFKNRRAESTVPRNYPDLRAYADLIISGSGLIEGHWEVDGVFFSLVSRHVLFGNTVTLFTPDVPPLPTFQPGAHFLRFVITSPQSALTFPSIFYYVTNEEAEKTVKMGLIKPLTPSDETTMDYAPARFEWEGPKDISTYLIEFYDDSDKKQIFSAYSIKQSYTIPEIALQFFKFGKHYSWTVKGLNEKKEPVAESHRSSFTFR